MAILFSDIRSYTTMSEVMSPLENLGFINAYLEHISPVMRAHHGIIEQYYGDGFKALFAGGAEDAIRAAIDLRRAVIAYNAGRRARGEVEIQIGVGVHTGPLLLGTIGDSSRMAVTVLSDIVNTAERLEGLTKIYGVGIILSDQTLRHLSDPTSFGFKYLGKVQVKGKTEPVSVYEAFDGELDEVVALKRLTKPDFEEGLRLYHARQFAEAGQHFNRVLQRALDDRAAQLYAQRALDNLRRGIPEGWAGVEVLTDS
jgi:two-component system, sensor histidine kinase ChiS